MKKTKANQTIRIVWENDIPLPVKETPSYQWQEIPWRKLERRIFKLQKRIYRASIRGDDQTVRRLQKTLINSWSAKCLAVRRVTQDNQGKKTAGIDGVKSLTPSQRLRLVEKLKLKDKAQPTRRIWIPKPGKEEKRPLGIPVMYDRALQALVKMALEPEWEARFEANSYGFRPGRCAQDAIEAIYSSINKKPKYVLDADITQCFDRIDQEKLLQKVNTFPKLKRQIRAWLKAGVIDQKQWLTTSEGTPQGAVLSPLLANIALHGLENRLKEFGKTVNMKDAKGYQLSPSKKIKAISLIRYADDLVVLHEDLTVIQQGQEILSDWLKDMGLELKPSKTRIAHTLREIQEEPPGFNFLGFHIRQYPVGRHHCGSNNGKLLGFKTVITPTKESIKAHWQAIAEEIENNQSSSQLELIKKLNPKIRGWANYFSSVCSKVTYNRLDFLIWNKLRAWAKRRHANQSHQYWVKKYWRTIGQKHWVFATHDQQLMSHAATAIVRHIKVQGTRSPYDGDLIYWSKRRVSHPQCSPTIAKLLRRQKGKCTYCGLYFREGDIWECDHQTPTALGGKNLLDNLQLLHKHCHDAKTRKELGLIHSNSGKGKRSA